MQDSDTSSFPGCTLADGQEDAEARRQLQVEAKKAARKELQASEENAADLRKQEGIKKMFAEMSQGHLVDVEQEKQKAAEVAEKKAKLASARSQKRKAAESDPRADHAPNSNQTAKRAVPVKAPGNRPAASGLPVKAPRTGQAIGKLNTDARILAVGYPKGEGEMLFYVDRPGSRTPSCQWEVVNHARAIPPKIYNCVCAATSCMNVHL